MRREFFIRNTSSNRIRKMIKLNLKIRLTPFPKIFIFEILLYYLDFYLFILLYIREIFFFSFYQFINSFPPSLLPYFFIYIDRKFIYISMDMFDTYIIFFKIIKANTPTNHATRIFHTQYLLK